MEHYLASCVNRLRRAFVQFSAPSLQKLGLTSGLLHFLLYIGRNPGCTPGMLAAAAGMDSGHTTRSIEKLVTLDYVRRTRSEADHRALHLDLTEAGNAAYETLRELFPQWDAQVLGCLSEEDKAQLFRILSIVEENQAAGQEVGEHV